MYFSERPCTTGRPCVSYFQVYHVARHGANKNDFVYRVVIKEGILWQEELLLSRHEDGSHRVTGAVVLMLVFRSGEKRSVSDTRQNREMASEDIADAS